ncbi:hypothetical protein [Desulfurispira natronophila]|uniref:Vacuolar-type H+-ATPase subunit I/STV1 n=1 Tax=Desulfurispira natronophila TaxID=682562 RepID=A0A7W7Y2W9_9BACT|nr:hypothetical protein [Desulfurispira natronophila]MBB5021101.1 vacuolar-type H+-ATPase subunit I/STV1 [Desulfurispira natronophila]
MEHKEKESAQIAKERKSLDRVYESVVKGISRSKTEVVKLTKMGKIKLDIINSERKKSRKLEELGSLTYDLLKSGNLQFDEDFLALIEEIEKIDAEIAVHQALLEELNMAAELNEYTPDEEEQQGNILREEPTVSSRPDVSEDNPEEYHAEDVAISHRFTSEAAQPGEDDQKSDEERKS